MLCRQVNACPHSIRESVENPYKIDLTNAIQQMEKEPEIYRHVDND